MAQVLGVPIPFSICSSERDACCIGPYAQPMYHDVRTEKMQAGQYQSLFARTPAHVEKYNAAVHKALQNHAGKRDMDNLLAV